ncbi:MAG: ATP-binding cassette domain-containing protein, partial [Myxococcota bacterium]|nr:ATP-binding cassette domain-containing protein [Myxococcota bacterium]
LRGLRRRFQMIYQSASAALNPGMTVEEHLRETIALHRSSEGGRALENPSELVADTLAAYGLAGRARARPGELSGGEVRRVCIARCLLPRPSLVIADEPTAGLDAAIKLEVLDLMQATRTPDMSYLFISHDLDVVRYVADRVLVMQRGRIVDDIAPQALDPARLGTIDLHPYTEALLASSFGAKR